ANDRSPKEKRAHGAPSLRLRHVACQRMVRGSLADAVTGVAGLITVASSRPSDAADWSVTRAANPTPATIIAQTSATATTLRWVARSAVSSEKLFMTPPKISRYLVAARRWKVQSAR